MEYIPLGSKKNKRGGSFFHGNQSKKKKVSQSPLGNHQQRGNRSIAGDPRLIPRVRQWLENHKNLKNVNVVDLAEELRKTYREYERKKKNAFQYSVMQAFDIICAERGVPVADLVSDSSSFDTSDLDEEHVDTNLVNNTISNLYKKVPPKNSNNLKFVIDKSGSNDSISSNTVEKDQIEVIETRSKKPARTKKKTANKGNLDGEPPAGKTSKLHISTHSFSDIAGCEKTLEEVCKLLVHMKHPEIYQQLGIVPPRGLLLHGPPGCGKSLLAHAICGELNLPMLKVAATEMVTGVSGESEEKIRELFEEAIASAPCVLFLDEIDAITPKRETAQREMEKRIVAQLLMCMDDLNEKASQVLVIGATNRPDSLDPALRRAGRFDREISLGIPDEAARCRILQVLCKKLKLAPDMDFKTIARNTPGYVGADLMALTREAAMSAVNRVFDSLKTASRKESTISNEKIGTVDGSKDVLETSCIELPSSLQELVTWLREYPPLTAEQLETIFVEMDDFTEALKIVQPSSKREGFATVPDVTWADIGALKDIREELELSILAPINHPEKFLALGLTSPSGILLCGPPGCGKTLLAKAVANESGLNFISVKGPELLNMYVGESERAVRQCFQRAKNSVPCVIFFDELDALCPKRSDSGESNASARVVNQLLTEMDGLEARRNVFVMGATNRPDIIDPAVLRPGRLDKILYVGLPGPEDKLDIIKTLTRNGTRPPIADNVNLTSLVNDTRCATFTGADLSALVREAGVMALKEVIKSGSVSSVQLCIENRHFDLALQKIKPSVSAKDLRLYEKMKMISFLSE